MDPNSQAKRIRMSIWNFKKMEKENIEVFKECTSNIWSG